MDRIILHCDLNYFYANVELLYHPEDRHLPVAVGGDKEKRHGIILAKNPLAKSFGVTTGEPLWQAKQKCPNLLIYSADTRKYQKFSILAKKIFSTYSDKIESFGLDEVWIDISHTYHLFGTPYHLAYLIKERIKKELGLTISIGISYNKIFAKLGSDYRKIDGITVINQKNKIEIIDPLPVDSLLYIGRRTKAKLALLNITTIGDLAAASRDFLKQNFGKVGEVLHTYANGWDNSEVNHINKVREPKSIGNSTTPPCDMCTYQDVYLVLSVLAQSVATRLKQHGLIGCCLSLGIKTTDLKYFTCQTTLDYPTNLYYRLLEEAFILFKRNCKLQNPLRCIGISLSKLTKEKNPQQLTFFTQKQDDKSLIIDNTLDQIHNRFGYSAINYTMLQLNKDLLDLSPKDEPATFPVG